MATVPIDKIKKLIGDLMSRLDNETGPEAMVALEVVVAQTLLALNVPLEDFTKWTGELMVKLKRELEVSRG